MIARTAAALGGLLALGLLGGPHLALAAVGAALVLVSPWLSLRGLPWSALTGLVALACTGAVLAGVQPTTLAPGALLAWLLLHRVLARGGPADDRALLLVSALLVALAAPESSSPGLLVAVALVGAAAPVVLLRGVLDDLGLQRARVPHLPALAVVGVAVAVFPLLPRVGAYAPPGGAVTGFSPVLDLQGAGPVDDPSPVVRLRFPAGQPEGPIYLRGLALDRFDGRRWTADPERLGHRAPVLALEALEPLPPGAVEVQVHREPVAEGVLFTTGRVDRLAGHGLDLSADRAGNRFAGQGAISYALAVHPPLGPAAPEEVPPADGVVDVARYTALPPLDPRVLELARSLSGDALDPWSKAVAMSSWLRAELSYQRLTSAGPPDPLADFLFERRAGHCEAFAGALAVLLRAEGVPARVVTGYALGEVDPVGGRLFRQSHAHAWVEVHVPGRGWLLVDPTPGPDPLLPADPRTGEVLQAWWRDAVLGYDLADQAQVAVGTSRRVEGWIRVPSRGAPVRGALVVAAGLLTLLGLGVGVARWSPRGRLARLHDRARARLVRAGWQVPRSLPAVEAARWVRQRAGEAAEPLERLAWLHHRVRYGGEDERALLPEARRLVRAVGRIPPPAAGAVSRGRAPGSG